MEILFSILAGVFAIIASIFGVKHRLGRDNNSGPDTNRGIHNAGSGYNDIVSDYSRHEREQEQLQELDKRDDDNIKRCNDIIERIRKREPETNITE